MARKVRQIRRKRKDIGIVPVPKTAAPERCKSRGVLVYFPSGANTV